MTSNVTTNTTPTPRPGHTPSPSPSPSPHHHHADDDQRRGDTPADQHQHRQQQQPQQPLQKRKQKPQTPRKPQKPHTPRKPSRQANQLRRAAQQSQSSPDPQPASAAHRSDRLPPLATVISYWEPIRRRLRLSPREAQVLQAIFEGEKFTAIAQRLSMSPHTVDTHWRSIKRKCRIKDIPHAIHIVYRAYIDLQTAPRDQAQSPNDEPHIQ